MSKITTSAFFIGEIAQKFNITYEDTQDLCHDALMNIFQRFKKGKLNSFPALNDTKAQAGYLRKQIKWQFLSQQRNQKRLGKKVDVKNIRELTTSNVEEYDRWELLNQLIQLKKVPLSESEKQLWNMLYTSTPVNKILDSLKINPTKLYNRKYKLKIKLKNYIKNIDIDRLTTQLTFPDSRSIVTKKNQEQDE